MAGSPRKHILLCCNHLPHTTFFSAHRFLAARAGVPSASWFSLSLCLFRCLWAASFGNKSDIWKSNMEANAHSKGRTHPVGILCKLLNSIVFEQLIGHEYFYTECKYHAANKEGVFILQIKVEFLELSLCKQSAHFCILVGRDGCLISHNSNNG